MALPEYINYNGNFLKKTEFSLSFENRYFLYNDGFFEDIFANGTKTFFLKLHIEVIRKKCALFGFTLPEKFLKSDYFSDQIASLLVRNKQFQCAKVRIFIYRKSDKNLLSISNEIEYLIESEKIGGNEFVLNEKGLKLSVYEDDKIYGKNPLLIQAQKNYLLHKIARYLVANDLNDCILINTDGEILETVFSSIFLVKDDVVYIVQENSFMQHQVMQTIVKEIALQQNIEIIENKLLTIEDVQIADEITLVNNTNGVNWIGAYGSRRYFNRFAKKIIIELNKLIKSN